RAAPPSDRAEPAAEDARLRDGALPRGRTRVRGRQLGRRRGELEPGRERADDRARAPSSRFTVTSFPTEATSMQAMSQLRPSASFSATLRVHLDDRPGAFAELARAIGDAGGSLGAIDLVRVESG